jgi:phage terminase large subunit
MPSVSLPFNYTPRPYQLPALKAMDGGAKRAVLVWHRRAGKEKTLLNFTIKRTFQRVGTYFYLFPTYRQAKKAIWDGMDRDGFPFLSHFPPEIVEGKDQTALQVKLKNGSMFQLIGTDNIDAVMSTNPIGCVFAEYSLQDPNGWNYIRPILRENGGWAAFDLVPRGKNHGYELYMMAKRLMEDGNPDWFAQKLTVEDTGAISLADIEAERREGMDEELIQQEFYCSFEGVQQGAIFGRQLEAAAKEGRICGVPWQPEFPVSTWWDIGTGDPTAIWFTQEVGREIHVIDYYENSGVGKGVDFYVKHLQSMPYVWGTHNGPHDIEHNSFAAGGKSAKDVAKAMHFDLIPVPRVQDKTDSLNAGRSFMQRCWFDAAKTERGLTALRSYHFEWNERRKMFDDTPYHDWSSNAADAFQTLAMGHKSAAFKPQRSPVMPAFLQRAPSAQDTGWLAS